MLYDALLTEMIANQKRAAVERVDLQRMQEVEAIEAASPGLRGMIAAGLMRVAVALDAHASERAVGPVRGGTHG